MENKDLELNRSGFICIIKDFFYYLKATVVISSVTCFFLNLTSKMD